MRFKAFLRVLLRVIKLITGWLVVQIVITYLLLNSLVFGYFLRPRRTFSEWVTPLSHSWHTPVNFESIRIRAADDKADIAGWYLPRSGATRAIVLVHGKDGSRTDEFFGRYIEFAAGLHTRDFAVLMIDMRGHGQSSDAYVGFGLTERHDVLGAVHWLETRGFARGAIGLHGVSMGGAAVLGAMADDARIGAVVADSAFSDVVAAARLQWQRIVRLPGELIYPGLWLARWQSGIDFFNARPIDDVARLDHASLMLIHGAHDMLVPLEQARELRQAAPGLHYWELPEAEHGGAYRVNPAVYLERVSEFYRMTLE
jgi:dipeptidyl aminopeptidase/acylaminoacyl peptidase